MDKFYPTPNNFVLVDDYKELDDHAAEIELKRQYVDNVGILLGGGFICDHDESMLTGLDISAFHPFNPSNALVAPMIPWNDDKVYTPANAFCGLWKHLNKTMAQETIRKITVQPSTSGIKIKVIFKI